jgi:hypothetical protein
VKILTVNRKDFKVLFRKTSFFSPYEVISVRPVPYTRAKQKKDENKALFQNSVAK